MIHAGDYVFPGVVLEFKRLNAKLIGVLGNNDGEKGQLLKAFLEVGGELKGELGELHTNDLKIGIYQELLLRTKGGLSKVVDIT